MAFSLLFSFLLPVYVEIAVIDQHKAQRNEKGIGFLEVICRRQEVIAGLQVELEELEADHGRNADQCLVEIRAHHEVSAIRQVQPAALVPVTEVITEYIVFEIVIEAHVERVRVRLDELDTRKLFLRAELNHCVTSALQADIRSEPVEMDLRRR